MIDKRIVARDYAAFCAVALAGLGELPSTIQTRSIVIQIRRRDARSSGEHVEPYRARANEAEAHTLRDRLHAWLATATPRFPTLPEGIVDRAADVWEPLISIADLAGGEWPQRTRVTAVTLVTLARRVRPSRGLQLLSDLKCVFGSATSLPTVTILQQLNSLEESPWGDLDGRPLDARRLARMLSAYEVSPVTIRFSEGLAKGYTKESMRDAWMRYVPDSPLQQP